MELKSLSDNDLVTLWNQSWLEFALRYKAAEPYEEEEAKYVAVRAEIVERGLGTLTTPPDGPFPTAKEDIYALTDREVFQRVVPSSTKKVFGSIALVGLTFLVGKWSRSIAYDLSWLFLVCFAIDILVVAGSTFMQLVLLVLQFWAEKARQTKYDIGGSLVRVVEGIVIFVCGYTLYAHFIL